MVFACKCLNVFITTGANSVTPVDTKDLELSDIELADSFFVKKNLLSIVIENISKVQESLVMGHNVGSWVIHNCMNCKMDVYASRRQEILISGDLLSDAVQIKELKQSLNFSSVFNIVLQPNISNDLAVRPNNRPFNNSDPLAKSIRLSSLNQQVSKHIQKLASDIEEKIRRFSEEQYLLLEKERTKIQQEHKSLVKILNDCDTGSPLTFSPFSNNSEFKYSSPLNTSNNNNRVIRPGKVSTPSLSSSMSARNSSDASDDFMFELEDVDHSPGATAPSEEEEEMSDTDDSGSHDEGIHIPRNKKEDFYGTKSLPMNIPTLNNVMSRVIPKKKIEDNARDVDIAASIKALAKSVHGDTPFGDLPRPRLNSQIIRQL